ncbi:sterol-sensing domain of SREBP cleavage-activation-domain-containing protein [Lipomyces japonicus]|uniref:sterol-sensing domain of SREBP cleavage-activation-domain-containing protein n=1 Tax=Lipomyces japonicus TaxID=56871 RepID=UPI0034CFD73E
MLRTIVLALFRGTTYANDLTQAHELYRIFQKYALTVVRSPQSFILWSATLSLALSYPFLHHWITTRTTSTPSSITTWLSCGSNRVTFSSDITPIPSDIELKQIWIQGASDNAIDYDFFKLAWTVQTLLLDGIPFSDTVLWSPMLYWDNYFAKFEVDDNILSTINQHLQPSLSNNLDLESKQSITPEAVFFGAKFVDGLLVSADSIIISLLYRPNIAISANYSAGDVWDHNLKKLHLNAASGGDLSNFDILIRSQNRSYIESFYRIVPMSHRANLLLLGGYVTLFIYVVMSLKRIHSVRSKSGLFIAFLVEITLSMTCACTVLHLTKTDIALIPKHAFPFIFIVVSTENMFRLVNALSYTKPEQPATVRMGTALGKVGFLSTVTVGSNVLFLLLPISICVGPIRQFCVFAIVSIITDYFLHMTYFVAVLSIDMRRLELEDLIQTSLVSPVSGSDDEDDEDVLLENGASWNPLPKIASFFSRGNVPTTTTAGAVVTLIFLISMHVHYAGVMNFNSLSKQFTWRGIVSTLSHVTDTSINIQSAVVNSLLYHDWFRIKEHLIDEKVLSSLVPSQRFFSIRLFEPSKLILNSYSTERRGDEILETSGLYFPTVSQSFLFIFVIMLVTTATALSLNHLLRDVRDEHTSDPRFSSAPVIVTKELSGNHVLDIVKLATSANGMIASVGLDHKVFLWQANSRRYQKPIRVPLPADAWPVTNVTLDSDGKFLAVCARNGTVHCWSIATSRFVWSVDLAGLHKAAPATTLFLTEKVPGMVTRVNLIVVGRNGILYQIGTETADVVTEHKISDVPIVSTEKLFTPRLPKRIVSATKDGRIMITMLVRSTWVTHALDLRLSLIASIEQAATESPEPPSSPDGFASPEFYTIIALPQVGMILRARSLTLELIDVQTGTIVKVFSIAQYRRGSLRAFHDHTQHCPFCGCSTIQTLCVLYCERETDMLIMHSFSNSNRARQNICLRVERDPREKRCVGFEGVVDKQHWLEDVSGWEVTDINVVMGIRRKSVIGIDVADGLVDERISGLRHRVHGSGGMRDTVGGGAYGKVEDQWEGWIMSMNGTVGTYELRPEEQHRRIKTGSYKVRSRRRYDDPRLEDIGMDDESSLRKHRHRHHTNEQDLLVAHIGPVCKIGHRSTVIGFGNVVKILYFGSEEIISTVDVETDDDDIGLAYVSRRRRAGRRSDSRGSNGFNAGSAGPRGLMGGGLMSGGLRKPQSNGVAANAFGRRGGLMSGGAARLKV